MILVRKANPYDAPDIIEFQIAMALETENLSLDRPTVEKGVAAVFQNPSLGDYYVVEADGLVIASLLTTFEWSDWRNGTVLWIQSVYVRKEWRGQGVFTCLYQHIRKHVETSETLRGIRLYADKTNTGAHAVYEKMGMSAEHYQLYEWLKN
jgi:GNAT superfamily N-acetyltransferase